MDWRSATLLLRDRYTPNKDIGQGVLQFEFNIPNHQLVFVNHVWFGEPHPHVAKISAPIGYVNNYDLFELTQEVGQKMLGGIYTEENIAYVVSSVMLDNSDIIGLENTLLLTAVVAQAVQAQVKKTA